MKSIPIKNRTLTSILDAYVNAFSDVPRESLPLHKHDDPKFTADYACGPEYLSHMQNKKVTGFPEKTSGVDFMQYVPAHKPLQEAIKNLDRDLLAWSGSRNNAVKMLYPEGGYMGWHHNANAPGHNLLLSWSKKGLGYFRYQDPLTKEIVTMQDTPGWSCKVGYFGSFAEKDKMFWHCASAKHEERLTVAYVIPHNGLWSDMCDDVQSL